MSQDESKTYPVDRASFGDDAVARLLRAAGPRAAVPTEDMARAKQAARAEWLRVAEAEKWRDNGRPWRIALALAASLALVAGAFLWQGSLKTLWSAGPEPIATLELAEGLRLGSEGEEAIALEAGEPLFPGATIETQSPGEGPVRAALRLAGGASLRLKEDSRLRLVSAHVFHLDYGTLYIDAPGDASLVVQTPLGMMRDIGTQFEVHLPSDGSRLRLRVREGVILLSRGERSHTAQAGSEVEVLPDGSLMEGSVPSHGEIWNWVQANAPGFDTEGRTVLEILHWASREAGWKLEFAEATLEASLAEASVGSSVILRQPEEGIAAALLSSGLGLEHRLEEGVLTVRRGP